MTTVDNTTPDPTGETQDGAAEEYVEIEEATDEDLTAYLDSVRDGEPEEDVPDEEVEEDEQKQEKGKKAEDDESSEETVTLTRSQLEDLREQVLKREQQVKQQEQFIQRRNSELGDLRKQLKEAQTKIQQGLDERFMESPTQALQDAQKLKDIEQDLQAIDHEEAIVNHVVQTYNYVKEQVPLDEVKVEDVRTTLRESGADEAYIENFLKNPYAHASGDALVHFFNRTRAEGALRKLVPYTKQLLAELEKARAKPEKLLREVSRAASSSAQITGRSGNSSGKRATLDVDPSKLSDADLSELAKELGL